MGNVTYTVEVVAADLNTHTVHFNLIIFTGGRASVFAPIIRGATERRATVAVVLDHLSISDTEQLADIPFVDLL
jgi:hypothetical protein